MTSSNPSTVLVHLGSVFARAQVPHALIGGHAVNAWIEPRYTADVDVTIQADAASFARLATALAAEGFVQTVEHGARLPSGPDFIRYQSRNVVLELQGAKTAFQHELIRRARPIGAGSLRVATPEDLIVLKLIADRRKDQVDLLGLAALSTLDWAYIEHWARIWGVQEKAADLRKGA